MSRIEPLWLDSIPELEDLGRFYEDVFGFVPNGARIMAHRPEIVQGYVQLRKAVMDPVYGTVPAELKSLIGHVASRVAGCRYCQAHTIFAAGGSKAASARVEAVWDHRTSDLFTPAERAALEFAAGAAGVPNGVTDEQFAQLRAYWDDGQIVEILAVVALYGFLNRWNDSLQTQLEEPYAQGGRKTVGALRLDRGETHLSTEHSAPDTVPGTRGKTRRGTVALFNVGSATEFAAVGLAPLAAHQELQSLLHLNPL